MLFNKAKKNTLETVSRADLAFDIVLIVALCILGVTLGLMMGMYAEFFPINGTFQNYNPVRRLLVGQIPYRDFQDYLGFGHLYLGTAFTVLFGGTYRSSFVAFTVFTFFGSMAVFAVLGVCITGRKRTALLMALCTVFFLGWQVLDRFVPAFPFTAQSIFSVGNSARIIRASILPISGTVLLYVFVKRQNMKTPFSLLLISLISAVAFLWCNDYGISCWLCTALMLFVFLLARRYSFIKALLFTLTEILCSFLFVFCIVELLTLGNFPEWFKSTFGTGGYQSWYYNSPKSYYIYDLDYSLTVILQLVLAVYYVIRLVLAHGTTEAVQRYGIPAYFNTTCFCAANEYRLLSGGDLREAARIVLFTCLIAESFRFAADILSNRNNRLFITASNAVKALLAAGIFAVSLYSFILQAGAKEGTFLPQLGGYNYSLDEDMIAASDFLDGRKFFSTYSSAQEVIEGQFQPSGTDYIIHVLGDDVRTDYMASYLNGDFDITATINEEYTYYEYWVQRANWFFYRELFDSWHPVFSNSYEVYWERNETSDENVVYDEISVEVVNVNRSTKKVVVRTDPSINGLADVFVDYSVNKGDGLKSFFLFNPMLYTQNTGKVYACFSGGGPLNWMDATWLKPESAEYIPITVTDGYGEVTLTSMPESDTELEIRKVCCERILTVQFDYLHVSAISESPHGKIELLVENDIRNRHIAEGVEQIKICGIYYDVINVELDKRIIIETDCPASQVIADLLKKQNMLHCIG